MVTKTEQKNTESAGAVVVAKDNIANPAPLGLLAFGMTTILLNIHNAGLFGLDSMILAMGICYGGIAQLIAGFFEFKKGNTFGATAFTSYGAFWLSLVLLLVLPEMGIIKPVTSASLSAYLFMWGIFTAGMFAATMRAVIEMRWIFATLTVLFLLLSFNDLTGIAVVKNIAGLEGIFCGGLAMYLGFKQLYQETYK